MSKIAHLQNVSKIARPWNVRPKTVSKKAETKLDFLGTCIWDDHFSDGHTRRLFCMFLTIVSIFYRVMAMVGKVEQRKHR